MARSTLLQLSENNKGRVIFPLLTLNDSPDGSYRGLLIDLARKWHKVETIYKLIDLASFYKLNYLQFHLTDDQLFTFPSENFPKLQTKDRHYTKEELLSVVDYAYQRGIVIVPEVDVPGHSMQFVKKYPEIFSISDAESGGEDLFGGRVDFVNVLNMGKEEVYTSLEKLFIEALSILNNQNLLENVYSLIIGGHQGRIQYKEELMQLVKKYNLENKLKIAHGLNKMPVAYSISNLILSSSIEPEAFGRVSVEAQSMEKPVLASDIGGSLETVINNKTGWLFKNNDSGDLAEKIKMIMKTEQNVLDLIGRQGRKNVKENYTRELMVSRTLEIYKSMVY